MKTSSLFHCAGVFVAALCVALAVSSIPATADTPGFTMYPLAPSPIPSAGSWVTIMWSGGASNRRVTLSLKSVTDSGTWNVGNVPNTGSFYWQLPPQLQCNRPYRFYIEQPGDVFSSAKHEYGPPFTLQCPDNTTPYDIRLIKSRAGMDYTISVINVGRPIVGAAQVTVTDSLPNGLTFMTGSATWTGPLTSAIGSNYGALRFTTTAGTIATNAPIGEFHFKVSGTSSVQKCATVQLFLKNNSNAWVAAPEPNLQNNTSCA